MFSQKTLNLLGWLVGGVLFAIMLLNGQTSHTAGLVLNFNPALIIAKSLVK